MPAAYAGRLLDKAMQTPGWPRDSLYVTNAVPIRFNRFHAGIATERRRQCNAKAIRIRVKPIAFAIGPG